MLEALLDAGAEIEARDPVGSTALMDAAAFNHASCVEALLKRGAEVNAATPDGDTALHRATELGYFSCVRLLLAWGADRSLRNGLIVGLHAKRRGLVDTNMRTAHQIAQQKGNAELAELLAC